MSLKTPLSFSLFAGLMLLNIGPSSAQISIGGIKIGVAAPLSGPFKLLGEQMKAGADAAAGSVGATLVIADDACTDVGGKAAAEKFVTEKVDVVIGFTCFESIAAVLPMLKAANIPTITTGVRANSLTDNKPKSGFLVYRLNPRDSMEADALADQLLVRWRDKPFAIIDDGTVHPRDLAESLRQAATDAGLKPVFTDTFRPGLENQAALARRLQKSGATSVFVGGDVSDALVISKNAQNYGGLELAIGESEDVSDDSGDHGEILSVTPQNPTALQESIDAASQLRQAGIEPDGNALRAYAAVEIANAAFSADAALPLNERIATGNFHTAIGAVSFDSKGDLAQNNFALTHLVNGRFVPFATTPVPAP